MAIKMFHIYGVAKKNFIAHFWGETSTTGWMERAYHFRHTRTEHNGDKLLWQRTSSDIVHRIIHAQMLSAPSHSNVWTYGTSTSAGTAKVSLSFPVASFTFS
jgi:hypothetical protein